MNIKHVLVLKRERNSLTCGRWHSLNANCSQLCVYFLSYFSRKGSKIYQINKKSQKKKFGKSKVSYYDVICQIVQFASKFV